MLKYYNMWTGIVKIKSVSQLKMNKKIIYLMCTMVISTPHKMIILEGIAYSSNAINFSKIFKPNMDILILGEIDTYPFIDKNDRPKYGTQIKINTALILKNSSIPFKNSLPTKEIHDGHSKKVSS